ncbi:MAG: hypothetical protein IT176_12880 [Acidobacteria bacterium]|nr:hypothetical protein [Acidobacteriota bacterium]
MAKTTGRKAPRRKSAGRAGRPPKRSARTVQRSTRSAQPRRAPARPAKSTAKRAAKQTARRRSAGKARPGGTRSSKAAAGRRLPKLDRARRILDDLVPTPPSSLNMSRRPSAARTGRAEMAEEVEHHRGMQGLGGGDVDVDLEDAYFTGDEAPGGDNPTPDQDVVEDIGKALGVSYDDAEELKSTDKIIERDRHRWEMDPASSEDYKERK